MRRFVLPIALLLGVYLDSIFFARVNISGVRPDTLMAVIVSYGVLAGSLGCGLLGLGMGLFMDILFGKYIGLSAIGYMFAGLVGGIFYQKFYADNVIIPAAVAAVSVLVKEHIMMLAVRLSGGAFSYGQMFGLYVVPCMLVTVALTALVHIVLKRALARQVKTEHRAGRRAASGGDLK